MSPLTVTHRERGNRPEVHLSDIPSSETSILSWLFSTMISGTRCHTGTAENFAAMMWSEQ